MRLIFTAAAVSVLTAVAGCSAAGRAHPVAATPSHTANARPSTKPPVRVDTRCLPDLPKEPKGVEFTDPRVIFLNTTRLSGADAVLTGSETRFIRGGDDDGHFDLVGPVRNYRVAADATVVVLANDPEWHQLCTDVQGLLALTPGANDPHPDPRQPLNDGLFGWGSHLAAIKTDRTGTIIRIEQLYRP